MKKVDFMLIGFSLCLMLCVSGCIVTKKDIRELQTGQHDLGVQIKDAQDVKQSNIEFNEDCVIEEIMMSKDSFGYYTKCPKEASHLKKEILKKSFPLMK